MKSEKIGILGTTLFLAATLVGFGLYLKSDTNMALVIPPTTEELVANLESTIAEKEQGLAELRASAAAQQVQVSELTTQAENLRSQQATLSAELTTKTVASDQLSKQLNEVLATLAEKEALAQRTQDQLTEQGTQLSSLNEELGAAHIKLSKFLTVTRKQREVISNQQALLADLKSQLQNAPAPSTE